MPEVTVIVPSACETQREQSIHRALDSVLGQTGAEASVLLAVNGARADPRLLKEVASRPGVLVLHREDVGLPGARLWARGFVRTDYFAFLDDDDELLAGGLAARVSALKQDADIDVVVTNGIRRVEGADVPCIENWEAVAADPLLGLMERNWLASCAGTYRTRSVGAEFWAGLPTYYEWTLVAFRLMARARIGFVSQPTFRIHSTPGSLSKAADFVLAEAEVLARALGEARSARVAGLLRRKRVDALHLASDYCRNRGRLQEAWRYHLRSLQAAHGWRFLPYTRRLMTAGARSSRGDGTENPR